MDHHQMTVRLFLLLICLILAGILSYFFISFGFIQLPFMSNNLIAVPVAQAPTASTSLVASTSPSDTSHSPTSVLPTVPTNPPPTSASTNNPPTQVNGVRTITNADNNATVDLIKDQIFAVNLGSGLRWTLQFSPSSSIEQVSASSTNAEQGSYKALVPGIITLKASGAPICQPRQACPMFLAVFSTTLNVR